MTSSAATPSMPSGTIGWVDEPADRRHRRPAACASAGWTLAPSGIRAVVHPRRRPRIRLRASDWRATMSPPCEPGYPDNPASGFEWDCRPRRLPGAAGRRASPPRDRRDRARWKRNAARRKNPGRARRPCTLAVCRAQRCTAVFRAACVIRHRGGRLVRARHPLFRVRVTVGEDRHAGAHPVPAHDDGRAGRLPVRSGVRHHEALRRTRDRRRCARRRPGGFDCQATARAGNAQWRHLGRCGRHRAGVGPERPARGGSGELPVERARRSDAR